MSLYKGNGFVLADKAVSFFAAVFVLRPDNIFAPVSFLSDEAYSSRKTPILYLWRKNSGC